MSGDPRHIGEAYGLPQELWPLLEALAELVRGVVDEQENVARARAQLGRDALIPYGDFLKANHISYDLGQRLRAEGKLKVLMAGGKLMVSKAHAEEFVRKLPLARG